MKNFNEGDRVSHPTYGEGTVFLPYDGTGWTTVEFDNGKKFMVDDFLLTPVPQAAPFKNGDRVQHNLHGYAGVLRYDEARKLVEIVPDGYGGSTTHVHPSSLTPLPEPTYHICIEEITGAAHVPNSLTAKQVANYIADSVDWRVAVEIKITKEGN